MTILSGINTKGWDDKHIRCALDFLYGDLTKFTRAIELMDKYGKRGPTKRFNVEMHEEDNCEDT